MQRVIDHGGASKMCTAFAQLRCNDAAAAPARGSQRRKRKRGRRASPLATLPVETVSKILICNFVLCTVRSQEHDIAYASSLCEQSIKFVSE